MTVPVETAETTLATVLFADMRGYTAIAEQLPPARVVPLLDEFFRILGKATEALAAGRANAVSAVTAVCASRTGCFARHLGACRRGSGSCSNEVRSADDESIATILRSLALCAVTHRRRATHLVGWPCERGEGRLPPCTT